MRIIALLCFVSVFGDGYCISPTELGSVTEMMKIPESAYLPAEDFSVGELVRVFVSEESKEVRALKVAIQNGDRPGVIISLQALVRAVLIKLARAQEFRNHIHLILSDLLANAEYVLEAKSPDGISLDEFHAILGKQLSLSNMNNSQLLQFMEGDGLNKLKEDLNILPQASQDLIDDVIRAYKDKTAGYQPDLSKNGRLKVYLGTAVKPTLEMNSPVHLISADAPAKPTLEVSSPAIVDEFDQPQETKLSLSDAVDVDKQLGNSKAKTPPASPVRRSPFLSQFNADIQQTSLPRPKKRGSRFSLDGKDRTTRRVTPDDNSKPRQNGFNLPLSPHDKDGKSYSDSVEQRKQQRQAFRNAQQSKLNLVNQEARDAAMRSQIKVSGER